jgi:predicted DNA-binding WGR domain protein
MEVELQQTSRKGATKVWKVAVQDNEVTVVWGLKGGALQTTVQTFNPLNVGKANEKSSEVVATEWAERQILLKTRKGYLPEGVTESTSMDFDSPPRNLRFFKPQNSLTARLTKRLEAGQAWALRKRDGMMHALFFDSEGTPCLYSSNMLSTHKDEPDTPWLVRYPHLLDAARQMDVPPNSVLLGELCCLEELDEDGFAVDDFSYVGSIVQSLTDLALQKQEVTGRLGMCVWDVAFWGGECLLRTRAFYERYDLISSLVEGLPEATRWFSAPELLYVEDGNIYVTNPIVDTSIYFEAGDSVVKTLLDFAKDKNWEGYVVTDQGAEYDDRAYNFRGKPERPSTVGKLKPKLEADFIVRWDPANGIGELGKGKKMGGVGSVMAYLLDPETGLEVPISKVGGGLTDADVTWFADPKLYPLVWQVEFSAWTKPTEAHPKGSLRHPEFVRLRSDKTVEECTTDQIPSSGEDDDEEA